MFSKEDFPFVMIEVLQSGHYDHGIDKVWREGDDICENKEVVFRPVDPLERIVCWRRTKSSITVGRSGTVMGVVCDGAVVVVVGPVVVVVGAAGTAGVSRGFSAGSGSTMG